MKKLVLVAILAGGMLTLSTLIFAGEIQIGTVQNAIEKVPIYAYYAYSYSQQIYLKPEINITHQITINKIRFYYHSGSNLANSNEWTIYLGHTSKNEFESGTDWIPLTHFTKVFEGNISSYIPGTDHQWMEIPLTTKFTYNNIDNLVVTVDENTSGSDNTTYWGAFPAPSKFPPMRALYCISSTDDINPLAPGPGTRTSQLNAIQLGYEEIPNPVELTSFLASISNDCFVTLSWTTQSETEMSGYYILRNNQRELSYAQTISPLIAATNTSGTQIYNFVDNELNEVGQYFYWLQCVNLDGSFEFHGPIVIYFNPYNYETPGIPIVTKLGSAYPNPFNPNVYIPYTLGAKANVNIQIYNSRGQQIKSYYLGTKDIGHYQIMWNGKDNNGHYCDSGIYYIIMKAGEEVYKQKAVLMK